MSNDTLPCGAVLHLQGLIIERRGMAEDLLDHDRPVFGPIEADLATRLIFVARARRHAGVVAA